MGAYAGLGLAYSFCQFCGTFLLFLAGVRASYNLFNKSLHSVMGTSVGWHDQTPIGRIVSRLSKDITVMDDMLPRLWNAFLSMSLNILGTVALVFYCMFSLLSVWRARHARLTLPVASSH
jgi:ATP-binding cassette subfamily C (CFTR/MRP) protein 1